jgi:Rrf2 family protein
LTHGPTVSIIDTEPQPSCVNTHFAVAVHILVFIAEQGGAPVTSQTVAGSVGTNPSFVRRVVAQLGRAGLTKGQEGIGGGTVLARDAASITLRDVYHAVDESRVLVPLHPSPHPLCKVGGNITSALGDTVKHVEDAVNSRLERTTIADVLADVNERARRKARA